MSDFPHSCLKGLPNEDFLTESGLVHSQSFSFTTSAEFGPDWFEESVNWWDNDQALHQLLDKLTDEGRIRYRAGMARIPREELDRLAERSAFRGRLRYERREKPDNPFHGNLLLASNLQKFDKRLIAAAIAAFCSVVPRD